MECPEDMPFSFVFCNIFLSCVVWQLDTVMLYCKQQVILIMKWDSTVSSCSISRYSCGPDVM